MRKISETYHGTGNVHELIGQLDTTLSYLTSECDIDQGGCVWTAWCITKELETYGIPFEISVYGDKNLNVKDVEGLVKQEELVHLGVIVEGEELGDEIDQEVLVKHGLKREVIQMTSEEILNLYNNNKFNGAYDPSNNEWVQDEIEMCFQMVL